jgi:hypothetical protein
MKSTEITNIIESILAEEVKNAITTEEGTTKRVKYHVTCEGEPLASFDSVDEAKDYVEKNKDGELKGKKKLLIDKKTYGSYQEMIDHLDEIAQSLEEKETPATEINEYGNMQDPYEYYDEIMEEVKAKVDEWLDAGKIDEQEHYEMYFKIDSSDYEWDYNRGSGNKAKHILIQLAKECAPHLLVKKKKETENMENQEPMEGNAYIKAMLDAKEKGEESFEVDGETHNVKESWKQLEEEEGMCEGAGCSGEMMEGEICETCGCKECECGKKETNEGDKGTCSECGTMLQEDGSCNECSGKMNESEEEINEGENQPTNPSLWSQCKAKAKAKFDVYPSAYANGWAAKLYKSKGGGLKKKKKSTNEEVNETKKVKIRLSESELTKLISKLVMEAIPGLEAVKKSHSQSSGQDLKDSNKKIDDYLKGVSGSTKPEFPNQEGTEKEKEAYRNTSDEEEFIDTYRGKGLQDLDYDNKPSKEFIERLRMALEGDPKMGNGQKDTANTTPSNVGKDLYKSIDKEKKTRHAEPAYKKDPTPTKEVNESVKKDSVVLEEMNRIKNMANYNKKTQ